MSSAAPGAERSERRYLVHVLVAQRAVHQAHYPPFEALLPQFPVLGRQGVGKLGDVVRPVPGGKRVQIVGVGVGVAYGLPPCLQPLFHCLAPSFSELSYLKATYFYHAKVAVVTNGKGQKLNGRFVVFDIETTGFSSLTCQIIEIGAVLVENGEITDRFSTFVNPKVPIPFRIEQLTSINDSMVTVSYTHLDVYKRQGM